MSDNSVPIDTGSGPTEIDTSQVDTGAGVVQRQRIVLGDNSAAENFLAIGSDGSASVHILNQSSSSAASVSILNQPNTQNVAGSVNVVGAVGVAQLTNPWIVSGSVVASQGSPPWSFTGSSVSVLNPTTSVNASVSVSVASVAVTVASVTALGGTVNVGNFPNVQEVAQSGNWSASINNIVPVSQSGAPWTVDAIQQGNWAASISNVVPVSQSGSWSASVGGNIVASQGPPGSSPWPVSGSISAIQTGPWSEVVSGSVTAIPYGNQTVSGSISAIQTGLWSVNQGTNPWITSGTSTVSGSVSAIQAGQWSAVVSGSVTAQGSVNASFTDYRPTAASITNADTTSSTTTGQNGATIITGSASVGSFASTAINGEGGARVQLSGNWSGTIEMEGSPDNGTTWYPMSFHVVGTGYRQASWTANGLGFATCSGLTNFRARATSWTSGVATVTLAFSTENGAIEIVNPVSIWDNTQGTQITVAPGGGAASVGNSAAVVALSPNTPLPSGSNAIGSVTVAGSVNAVQSGYWQQGSWPVGSVNVGQTSASTAAVQVHGGSIVPINGVIVQALSTNGHSVFVGGTGVTTSTGFELQAGQPTSFVVSNVSLLYVVGSSSVDAICWNVT